MEETQPPLASDQPTPDPPSQPTSSPVDTASEPVEQLVHLGERRALDPREVRVARIGFVILTLVLSGAASIALLVVALTAEPSRLWLLVMAALWLTLTAVLVVTTIRWPRLDHARRSYRIDEGGIEIVSGVWWRSIVSVPRSRVQHIDVSQGPIERRYGLATLTLYTAGNQHAQVQLGGLEHRVALAVRDHLLPAGGDDAV